MPKLAVKGGKPVRKKPYPEYVAIGRREARAVAEVMKSTVLSRFLGTWSPDFYGGDRVRALESEWCEYFGVPHAISVNSGTSGLNAALGATGVGPGDEVICSPFTMSASAACALVYNAIPVFADIDPETYCISAETIAARITERTKAIVVVDIFGHPAEMDAIMALAAKHKLKVVEDAAQAPGALYHGRPAGTLADLGVFSLNYHKTIHTGEGGVVVTRDPQLAEKVQLIRNHAEVVITKKEVPDITNLLGFNYRMGELEAAIASVQLTRLEKLLERRIEAADRLTAKLSGLPGFHPPAVKPDVKHGYYVYAMRLDPEVAGCSRQAFAQAVAAEGVPLSQGYVEPIYLQPLYQKRQLYGRVGCPFSCPYYGGTVSYDRGLCPVTERMHYRELMLTNIVHADIRDRDLDDFANAIHKVYEQRRELA